MILTQLLYVSLTLFTFHWWCYNILHNALCDLTNVMHTHEEWYPTHLISLRCRHNGCDSVSNHQPHDCLLNRLFRRRSKKTSKLSVTGLCVGNSLGTGEFSTQMASNAENYFHLMMSSWSSLLTTLFMVEHIIMCCHCFAYFNASVWKLPQFPSNISE